MQGMLDNGITTAVFDVAQHVISQSGGLIRKPIDDAALASMQATREEMELAPIPFATFDNREQSHTGQKDLPSLFALGFQGFPIMICVGIYAVLIRSIVFSDDML